jgi:hypothetical protein
MQLCLSVRHWIGGGEQRTERRESKRGAKNDSKNFWRSCLVNIDKLSRYSMISTAMIRVLQFKSVTYVKFS